MCEVLNLYFSNHFTSDCGEANENPVNLLGLNFFFFILSFKEGAQLALFNKKLMLDHKEEHIW